MQPQNKYLQVHTDINAGFHTRGVNGISQSSEKAPSFCKALVSRNFVEISILYTPYTECIVSRPKVSRIAVLATGDGS